MGEYPLPFREISRVNNKLIDAGGECVQDRTRQMGGQGAAGVTRRLGALTRTTCVCAACAFVGLETAGAYARMREDTPLFQEIYGGGSHHISEIGAFVWAMMPEDDAEEAEAAGGGGARGRYFNKLPRAYRECADGEAW